MYPSGRPASAFGPVEVFACPDDAAGDAGLACRRGSAGEASSAAGPVVGCFGQHGADPATGAAAGAGPSGPAAAAAGRDGCILCRRWVQERIASGDCQKFLLPLQG